MESLPILKNFGHPIIFIVNLNSRKSKLRTYEKSYSYKKYLSNLLPNRHGWLLVILYDKDTPIDWM